MTFLLIAILALVVFVINAFVAGKAKRLLDGSVIGVMASVMIACVACVFAADFGVTAFATIVTVAVACVAGIVAAIGFDRYVRKAFANLHQLT